jgi:hypothetical protein
VTQACNPSYSGGRDQEDHSSKPAQANGSWDPISKKPFTKKRLVECIKTLSSSPSTTKKKTSNKCRAIACSLIRKLNTLKNTIFTRLIYKFNIIPIKIPGNYL